MKKSIIAILVLLCMSMGIFAFAGCNNDTTELSAEDPNFAKYDESTVVEGSAYDLIWEAYQNWQANTGYIRDERFSFRAFNGPISFATRETHLIRKMDGEQIYSQEIIIGTGQDDGSCAKKYYFDGANAYSANNTNKRNLDYDKDTDTFTTKSWGEFVAFEGDVEKENYLMKEQLTTYDFSDRSISLSPKHNDKVYKVGDTYYVSMTLDCTLEKMRTLFRVALDDFLATTDADEEGFQMKDDKVVFDFAIKEINGQLLFTTWRRTEIYSGKYKGITINCEQTCLSNYKYEGYDITSEDLMNLA